MCSRLHLTALGFLLVLIFKERELVRLFRQLYVYDAVYLFGPVL
jgi:hypothetical protein